MFQYLLHYFTLRYFTLLYFTLFYFTLGSFVWTRFDTHRFQRSDTCVVRLASRFVMYTDVVQTNTSTHANVHVYTRAQIAIRLNETYRFEKILRPSNHVTDDTMIDYTAETRFVTVLMKRTSRRRHVESKYRTFRID